jgi:hypothetical protein
MRHVRSTFAIVAALAAPLLFLVVETAGHGIP